LERFIWWCFKLALGEYLRGAGGGIGDGSKTGSGGGVGVNPNAGLTAENYGMGNNQPIIDPFQTNPTVSGMNITNDMPFSLKPESMRVKNKPIFDAFNYQP